MSDQSILDDIDISADFVEADAGSVATNELGNRLCRAQGKARNSVALIVHAAMVADVIDSLPAEMRSHTLVVFMRLVQRMMDNPEDCGERH